MTGLIRAGWAAGPPPTPFDLLFLVCPDNRRVSEGMKASAGAERAEQGAISSYVVEIFCEYLETSEQLFAEHRHG